MPAKATKSECNNPTSIQAQTISRLGVADEPGSTEMSEVPTTTTLEEIMNARGWNGDFTPRFLSGITWAIPKPTPRSTAIKNSHDDSVAGFTSLVSHHAR